MEGFNDVWANILNDKILNELTGFNRNIETSNVNLNEDLIFSQEK